MEIIKGVNMLESTEKSHSYLVQSNETILIDTGFPGLSENILEEIQMMGIVPRNIRHILLTHHDVDHVGNAKSIQQITRAELWAPKEDIPYITGERKRPGVKRIIQALVKVETAVVDNCYQPGQVIDGIHVIRAPGHTPGHVMFQYKNVLFVGDLFKVLGGKVHLPAFYMNWNQQELKKSLKLLQGLKFEWICPAHGTPIQKEKIWADFIEKCLKR
jgi:glyoxylase-like metal-dependent hydrolase (beta-lactamase superfamily II)